MGPDKAETETLRQRAKFRAAAILLLSQGALMEGGVFVAFVVLQLLGVDQSDAGERFSFIVPYFQDHLYLMMVMSGVFGALRIVGAAGLLRNRLWGLALSVINCVTTLALMIFLLPAGIVDGLLSGSALLLMLHGWFGAAPIAGRESVRRSMAQQTLQ
jgi:hypothetical protein